MKFSVKHSDLSKQRNASLIIGVSEKGEITTTSKILDKTSQNTLVKWIKQSGFQGKTGQTWLLPALPNTHLDHILLVGSGKTLDVNERDFRKIITASIKALGVTSIRHAISFLTELNIEKRSLPWKIKLMVETSDAALYQFNTYKSEKTPANTLEHITFYVANQSNLQAAEKALKQGLAIATGVVYTKNLANHPSNICTPSYLADQAKKLGREYKAVKVKVLEEKDLKKLGMGAFLAVTKGSAQDAKLVCLEYKGTSKHQAPVAIVGKGITFDTGGISLKPAESMVGMKYDMCGAATVLGVIKAVAEMKLPIHIVGVLAIAENMPGGKASKPEDIVTTMSGQTVEILNTDAEGRLVLCDALTYCERFKPDVVIDIATLTGAAIIALGHHATCLLSNNEKLAADLLAAGNESYDRAWQLPLWDEYQEQLRSPFADMANIGGRTAGVITAGCFLSRFTKKFHWAHLDVAGTAAMMSGTDRYATGRPVPMLTQYLINRCEPKKK